MYARSRRLRVLFLIDHAGVMGGAERFVTGLATHLPRDRVEATVCSTRHGSSAAVKALSDAGVPHLDIGRQTKWDMYLMARLARILHHGHFDVLHSHMFGSNVWGTTFGRACGVPVILAHEHNWSYSGDRLRLWLDGNLVGRLATRVITVSQANRRRMMELEGISTDKIVVRPTGYIPSLVTHHDLRAELGVGPDVPLVGNASILRPEKALEVLIQAHALVRGRVPEARLVIAGHGPCEPHLRAEVSRLGTEGAVHFLGARRDVDSLLRAVDVGAMSSDWEGMPLFMFECMAAGTPLVATSVGGVPEVVRDGETGLLAPPRDAPAMANALVRILLDPQLGDALAAAAARRLPEYSIDTVAGTFADLYERLYDEAVA
jgi:glycosyltransferase involved in cell wall biosynthesis